MVAFELGGPLTCAAVPFGAVDDRLAWLQQRTYVTLALECTGRIANAQTLDNIDQGKTFEYFKYMGEHYKDKAPQFVMKVDDDVSERCL
jgi:hypothetical protein